MPIIVDIKKNNLNNFYNYEQCFARTSPLRGPFRPRVAARETTKNNDSPRTRFLLNLRGHKGMRTQGEASLLFSLVSRQLCFLLEAGKEVGHDIAGATHEDEVVGGGVGEGRAVGFGDGGMEGAVEARPHSATFSAGKALWVEGCVQ